MITLQFLVEWAVRSSALILGGGLLLYLARVKNPSVRLAAWTVVLCGSLAVPVIGPALPQLPLTLPAAIPIAVSQPAPTAIASSPASVRLPAGAEIPAHIDWARAAARLYLVVSALLLLRLFVGSLLAYRLRCSARNTGLSKDGIRVLESERIASPVTLGLSRPDIVLPGDWGRWDACRLSAVLAHERSHVLRRDPAVQWLSAAHRALLWFNPLSWHLHRSIVELAEEVSDNAAIAVTRDRASYAELLLDFMRRGVRGPGLQAIAMSRYGNPEKRIQRILDGNFIPGGVSRRGIALIALIALPVVLVVSAAGPRLAAQARAAKTEAARPANPAASVHQAAPAAASQAAQKASPSQSSGIRRYIIRMGDHMSGSWDSRDPVDENALRSKFGDRYAWFRQDSKEYAINDSGVMAEFAKAMEPQEEVNKLQSGVNALQEKVNEKQSGVNEKQQTVNHSQEKVNAAQEVVNRRQDLVNRIQHSVQSGVKEEVIKNLEETLRQLRSENSDANQERVNALQSEVNKAQQEVNKAQSLVNAEQEKVNHEQQKVNEVQQRVSAEFNRRMREIFDSALRRGLAQPWK